MPAVRILQYRQFLFACLCSCAVVSPSSAADDLFWKFSTGFEFSRGDYGLDQSTDFYYVPIGITLDYRRLRAKLHIPLIHSVGPSEFGPTRASNSKSRNHTGLGQIRTSLSYLFDPLAVALPYIEITGRVGAPTESNRSLGPDVWTFSTQIDLFKQIGRFVPFAGFGRKFYARSTIQDRFNTSVGSSLRVSRRLSVGLAYDWFESTTNRSRDQAHELVPFATFRIDESWLLGPYAVVGLSRGAPNYAFGFSLSVRP